MLKIEKELINIKELEKKYKFNSKVFDKYISFSVDLLCNLITLPIEEKSYDDLFISYQAFVKEFMKIEENISSSQYNLYILKCIIESARKNRKLYLEENEVGINAFRKDVNHAIFSVSKFCSPRGVHYEKMLLSLYTFASCAEGYISHFMKKKMNKKYEEYEKIPVKGILDIIQILNVNLDDNYVYSEDTRLVVIDTNRCVQKEIELDEDIIEVVNGAPKELKGLLLYNYYVKGEKEGENDEGEKEDENVVDDEEDGGQSGDDDNYYWDDEEENELSGDDFFEDEGLDTINECEEDNDL